MVIAIVGVLAGLTLPAIQAARETSRRMSCENNLRNQTIAVLNYEEVYKILPVGRNELQGDWAWSFYTLPMLDQSSLYLQFKQELAWNDPENIKLAKSVLPVFRCPSSVIRRNGDTDYAGIVGTIFGIQATLGSAIDFNRGTLVYLNQSQGQLTLASITDGTSNTIGIAESPDRDEPAGLWVSGANCISHDRGNINRYPEGIRSFHWGGAHASRMDGGTVFLSEHVDLSILAAFITRSGNETLQETP